MKAEQAEEELDADSCRLSSPVGAISRSLGRFNCHLSVFLCFCRNMLQFKPIKPSAFHLKGQIGAPLRHEKQKNKKQKNKKTQQQQKSVGRPPHPSLFALKKSSSVQVLGWLWTRGCSLSSPVLDCNLLISPSPPSQTVSSSHHLFRPGVPVLIQCWIHSQV